MSSLDRLIDLAKQTGDRLIVHDPIHGRDLVLLDIDSYEHLMLGRRQVRELTEGQLLDQINRDIAVWRSHQEDEEVSERSAALEEELAEHPLADPFAEDFFHNDTWHSTADVIDEQYKPLFPAESSEPDASFFEDESGVEDDEDVSELDTYRISDPDVMSESEASTQPISPRAEAETTDWKEEPLPPEDPIFYEEPV